MTLLMNCISCCISRIRCISFLSGRKFIILMFMSIVIQGCSTLGEGSENGNNSNSTETSESLDSLSKDITDLVEVSSSHDLTSTDGNKAKQTGKSQHNLYLAQKSARLANVPAVVLEQYRQALVLMKKVDADSTDWQKAERLLNQVLSAQPKLSGAYVNKAIIALHKKDNNRANMQLDSAIAENPLNPYAYQLKGQIARSTGQFEQAETYYLKALEIWPNYPEAQVNIAILLELYRGRLLDARQYYLSYLELKADDQQVQRWLAGVEIKIKRAGLTLPEKANNSSSSSALPQAAGDS